MTRGNGLWARVWYLIDWKFQRYLTPHIIRVYWVMALVSALLLVADSGLSLLTSRLPETNAKLSFEFRVPRADTPSSEPSEYTVEVIKFVRDPELFTRRFVCAEAFSLLG